jgi:O-methyltransferase
MKRQIIDKILAPFGYAIIKDNPIISKFQYSDIDYIPSRLQDTIRELSLTYSKCIFKNNTTVDETECMLLSRLIGTSVGEALFIINCIQESRELEGDICEFGVAQGATSALMAYEIRDTAKNIWLYDSFEGLPAPSEKDHLKDDVLNLGTIDAYKGAMSYKEVLVKRRLSEIAFPSGRIKVIKGFIEDTISNKTNYPEDVCFAYVDFDFYEPIRTALEFLDQHLLVGAIVIVDDYDFFSTGVKTAVDEFISANPGCYSIEVPDVISARCCILKKIGKISQ